MSSVFTKIINKEIPAYIIDENDDFISILDINPVQVGHTLVIPKKEIDYIFDQDDYYLSKILIYSKKIAKALKSVIKCNRIGISVTGLEVPHTHVHLIPINHHSDMYDNCNKKINMTNEEMSDLLLKIKQNL